MEIDIDDVPWKDEMTVPTGPGWGDDVNEEVARAYPWDEASLSTVQDQGYRA